MYSLLCTVYCVLCTVQLCTVYCVLCTLCCELFTVFYVLCTVYCVLYTVYYVLCATLSDIIINYHGHYLHAGGLSVNNYVRENKVREVNARKILVNFSADFSDISELRLVKNCLRMTVYDVSGGYESKTS